MVFGARNISTDSGLFSHLTNGLGPAQYPGHHNCGVGGFALPIMMYTPTSSHEAMRLGLVQEMSCLLLHGGSAS